MEGGSVIEWYAQTKFLDCLFATVDDFGTHLQPYFDLVKTFKY